MALYELIDIWDGTQPGMPIDEGHHKMLREVFKTPYAMQAAIRDDLDDAIDRAGWNKCVLEERVFLYTAFFRPVLEVSIAMLRAGKRIKIWRCENGPAPPTSSRSSPIDGDALRLCEKELAEEHELDRAFFLGLHVYSDALRLSWSGGSASFT